MGPRTYHSMRTRFASEVMRTRLAAAGLPPMDEAEITVLRLHSGGAAALASFDDGVQRSGCRDRISVPMRDLPALTLLSNDHRDAQGIRHRLRAAIDMGLPALDPDHIAEVGGDEPGNLVEAADRATGEVVARFCAGSIDHLGAVAGRSDRVAEGDVVKAGEERLGWSRVAVEVVVLSCGERIQRLVEACWHPDS